MDFTHEEPAVIIVVVVVVALDAVVLSVILQDVALNYATHLLHWH